MTPIGELRASIPYALISGLSPLKSYTISVIGNIFIVFIILNLLNFVSNWLSKQSIFFNKFFNNLFEKTKKSHSSKIERYGFYGLFFFTAIPFPVTGGWTASLVSFVFQIPFKKAFPVISFGILFAGIIVLFLSTTGIAINKYFGWEYLSLFVLLILGCLIVRRMLKKSNNN
jgi:uncharacterized membrane protein